MISTVWWKWFINSHSIHMMEVIVSWGRGGLELLLLFSLLVIFFFFFYLPMEYMSHNLSFIFCIPFAWNDEWKKKSSIDNFFFRFPSVQLTIECAQYFSFFWYDFWRQTEQQWEKNFVISKTGSFVVDFTRNFLISHWPQAIIYVFHSNLFWEKLCNSCARSFFLELFCFYGLAIHFIIDYCFFLVSLFTHTIARGISSMYYE